jgi:hypothetical protein
MDVRNAALVEARSQLALGKTGSARRGNRAYIDQQFHPGPFEFVEHRFGRGLLIADGEEFLRSRHFPYPIELAHARDQFHRAGRRANLAFMDHISKDIAWSLFYFCGINAGQIVRFAALCP